MDRSAATVDILEGFHARICKLESMVGASRGLRLPLSANAAGKPSGSAYYSALAGDIDRAVKGYLRDGINTSSEARAAYVNGIADVIRPLLAFINGQELTEEMRNLFDQVEWSKSGQQGHMFVGVIWDAMKSLKLEVVK